MKTNILATRKAQAIARISAAVASNGGDIGIMLVNNRDPEVRSMKQLEAVAAYLESGPFVSGLSVSDVMAKAEAAGIAKTPLAKLRKALS